MVVVALVVTESGTDWGLVGVATLAVVVVVAGAVVIVAVPPQAENRKARIRERFIVLIYRQANPGSHGKPRQVCTAPEYLYEISGTASPSLSSWEEIGNSPPGLRSLSDSPVGRREPSVC